MGKYDALPLIKDNFKNPPSQVGIPGLKDLFQGVIRSVSTWTLRVKHVNQTKDPRWLEVNSN